ncbi:CsbD family protein [Ramlibacter sp. AN1015]|uniref:CsbD family protein n=1 Tax=Ramlibacter sp. AN1015 TaxID=3133428 RepID=UPI0030BF452D
MNKDQAKGSMKEVAGKAQKEMGDALDSPKHEGKGMAREAEGKVQKNYGEAKEGVNDAMRDEKERTDRTDRK